MSRTHEAQINDRRIAIRPRETVLEAALRSGIDFPNSCRVGGCGTCKCRLVEGEVRELTETGYLLTAEELERRTILACQSVPRSDVRIAVELAARRRLAGTVVARDQVTHDIVRLEVQLEAPLTYRAGQYARLELDALPGVARCYSFATPPRGDGRVSFTIRKVPGGRLSSFVHDEDVVGSGVRVAGPEGDFWLRPGDAPLVLVAGGSGLPPILALLEEAAAAGVERPVTLLFGARAQRDLYALEAIEALARRWKGPFRFVPVLSDAAGDDSWSGRRGLVTEAIAELLEAGAHAYLCGPPAMIDAAVAALAARGVAREHIHADRFTTSADTAPPAGLLHYAKFFSFHAVGLIAAAALAAGGAWIPFALLATLAFYFVGDALGGDDTSTPTFRHPRVLTAQLWLALPLLATIVFLSVWREGVAAWLLTGLMIGMVGTIPAHELTHRTWDPVSMAIGRWLLAFSFDTPFAIEHVYVHHRYVSTTEDPATAPRGRNAYAHVVISTLRGYASAWRIEAQRLARRRLPLFSRHNVFLRGQLMSLALVAIAAAIGGVAGMAYFAACALMGKALLEVVN